MPKIGPRDVLLEVSHCGVCGTDLHYVLEGWGNPTETIEGHEFSARVVATGDAVRALDAGRRGGRRPVAALRDLRVLPVEAAVAVYRQGRARRARRVPRRIRRIRARPRRPHRRDPAVGLAAGRRALEPLAVALHGLTQGGVRAGQRILVTGAGPIGTLSIAAARARGVTDIVVSEPHPLRRALAERLGAVAVEPDTLVTPAHPGHDRRRALRRRTGVFGTGRTRWRPRSGS